MLNGELKLPGGRAVAKQVFVESCRRDPNPFVEYVLGVEQAPLHENIQDHYTEHRECGIGVHRGGGKTVQTLTRIAWEVGHDSSARWKYVQANDGEACKSVEMTKRIIESPRYRHVFPEVRPDPTLWGKSAFRLVTEKIQRDPTVEAVGIFGHAGGRVTDLVCDDVCTLENAVRMAALRVQVKEAYHNTWRKMLTGDRQRTWCIFTPWHVDDITRDWKKRYQERKSLLWRPVVDYVSPWPKAFTPEWLREKEEENPIAYARAYLLEPLSAEVLIWPSEWLQSTMFEGKDHRTTEGYWAQTIDFAFSDKKLMKAGGAGDPDWSVSLIAFVDHRGHAWVHDMLRVQTSFPEFNRAAIAQGAQWGVKRGKAEATAGQRGLVQQMNEDSPYPIDPVDRIKDKVFRAGSLQSFVHRGRWHIMGSDGVPIPRLEALYNEMVTFPMGGHDDTVDTAMDMMEMATKGAVRSPTKAVRSNKDRRVHQMYGMR